MADRSDYNTVMSNLGRFGINVQSQPLNSQSSLSPSGVALSQKQAQRIDRSNGTLAAGSPFQDLEANSKQKKPSLLSSSWDTRNAHRHIDHGSGPSFSNPCWSFASPFHSFNESTEAQSDTPSQSHLANARQWSKNDFDLNGSMIPRQTLSGIWNPQEIQSMLGSNTASDGEAAFSRELQPSSVCNGHHRVTSLHSSSSSQVPLRSQVSSESPSAFFCTPQKHSGDGQYCVSADLFKTSTSSLWSFKSPVNDLHPSMNDRCRDSSQNHGQPHFQQGSQRIPVQDLSNGVANLGLAAKDMSGYHTRFPSTPSTNACTSNRKTPGNNVGAVKSSSCQGASSKISSGPGSRSPRSQLRRDSGRTQSIMRPLDQTNPLNSGPYPNPPYASNFQPQQPTCLNPWATCRPNKPIQRPLSLDTAPGAQLSELNDHQQYQIPGPSYNYTHNHGPSVTRNAIGEPHSVDFYGTSHQRTSSNFDPMKSDETNIDLSDLPQYLRPQASGNVFHGVSEQIPATSSNGAIVDPRAGQGASFERSSELAPGMHYSRNPKLQSSLLEHFKSVNSRANKPRWELRDIIGHVVEFSGDQHGSRFIQTKLETANSEEKGLVFAELRENINVLIVDVFGNYVVQKFIEHGDQLQKGAIVRSIKGQVHYFSKNLYGCRVIQKLLEHVLVDQKATIVSELQGVPKIDECVRSENGNYVLQKAVEHVPYQHIGFLVEYFVDRIQVSATHRYGCRIVQRLLEQCPDATRNEMIHKLHSCAESLIADQFGNYVPQHIIEQGTFEERNLFISVVKRNLLYYSKEKFASNVVEKCIVFGTEQDRYDIMMQICQRDGKGKSSCLGMLTPDGYGNYVVQSLIHNLNDEHFAKFTLHLEPELYRSMRAGVTKHNENVYKALNERKALMEGSSSFVSATIAQAITGQATPSTIGSQTPGSASQSSSSEFQQRTPQPNEQQA